MKKIGLLAFVLVLLSTAVVVGFVRPAVAEGTIYIKDDGSVVGTDKIQRDGDVYTFLDNIYDGIVVERDNIVVDGAGYTLQRTGLPLLGISLTDRSNVTIKNMEIKSFYIGIWLNMSSRNIISGNNVTNNEWHGIWLASSDYNSIAGNNITQNNWYGICLEESSNNDISGDNITNNDNGILLYYSSNNTLRNNDASNNNGVGIGLSYSSNNTLRNNDASNNKYNFGVYGSSLSHYIQDIDNSNTVNGKPIYHWVNRRDMAVPLDAGYVALVNCTNITVKNINLANNGQGMLLALTTNSTITQNNVMENHEHGILLTYSSNYNSISENTITSNEYGIWLASSDYNSISGNTVAQNNHYGIKLCDSSNCNSISGNTITNNWEGIRLIESSNYNSISENHVTANNMFGVVISESSDYNSISGNNVTNNVSGIRLYGSNNTISGNNIADQTWGIYLTSSNNTIQGNNVTNNGYGIELDSANYNIICHNNFVDNTDQVYSYEPTNIWDDGYPSGGNYWSDHVTVDDYSGINQDEPGSDGIVDELYVIDDYNRDNYPLMAPINFFDAGTWNEVTYYVHTVSNSIVSDFDFNPDDCLISFNVTGPDDTVGFCRVTIPNELLWCDYPEQWEVWVNNTLIEDRKIMEDTNCTYIYFTYNQTIQNVEVIGIHVIPEFPTWTSILLVFVLLTVAIAVYKRRLLKTPTH